MPARTLTTSAGDNPRLSGPFTHDNLSVFLIHGEDRLQSKNFLTLPEALDQKKFVIHETQSVNELTMENLSADPGQEYLADGMTESIITELGRVRSLRVISRQSMMQFKHTRATVPRKRCAIAPCTVSWPSGLPQS